MTVPVLRATPTSEEPGWKQHFPTYLFENRDIAIKEYEFATKVLEAEERVFLNAVNISILIGAALGSLALGTLERLVGAFAPVVPEAATLVVLILLAFGFGSLLLRHFANRQKAVVFAARKVIVLRRMLGMSYGTLQLVLPNWRIEGADEPFAIRLFPGWNTYVTYPCFAIAGISSVVGFFVLAALMKQAQSSGTVLPFAPLPALIGLAAIWFGVLCWVYRKALLDTHERTSLLFAQRVASALRLRLVPNFEYVIYRATLATYELHRLGINLSVLAKFLIHLEDKEFATHIGVSAKGMARLALSATGLGRRTGGSTITQQLVRTLFIQDQTKLVRRKLVEILLAIWFHRVASKSQQLEMYLAAVRFEIGILGVAAAMKHFFGSAKKSPSSAESFFLIERVSNVRSRLLVEKIDETLRRAITAGVLSYDDVMAVIRLYAQAIRTNKIEDPGQMGITRLQTAWEQRDPHGTVTG